MERGPFFVPPGGFIGAGSQTQAAQIALGSGRRMNGGRKRKRRSSKRKSRRAPSSRKRSSRSKPRRGFVKLKKGSRAAKMRMAKLRAMRKRK